VAENSATLKAALIPLPPQGEFLTNGTGIAVSVDGKVAVSSFFEE
jgi:hypothetical protein